MARGPSTQIDPYLVASQPNVRFTSIIASGEALPGGGGLFGGIPDGIGAYDNGNGTITVLVNHELSGTVGVPRDHGGTGAYIDRLVIDKATLAVVSADDAIKQAFLWNTASRFVRADRGGQFQPLLLGRSAGGDRLVRRRQRPRLHRAHFPYRRGSGATRAARSRRS